MFILLPVSLPILFALITAAMLLPLVTLLTRMIRNREISVWIIYLTFWAAIFIAIISLSNTLLDQLGRLLKELPAFAELLNQWWIQILTFIDTYTLFSFELNEVISESSSWNFQSSIEQLQIMEWIQGAMNHFPLIVFNLIFYVILLLLFMLELPKLVKRTYDALPRDYEVKIKSMLNKLKKVFVGFLIAQFLIGIPIVVVTFIGLLLIVPEVAIIMTLIIWLIDFIPFIGSIVILAPWASYSLVTGNQEMAIQLLVLAAILLIIRRTVEPKVMGTQIGLSPLLTIVSMYVGFVMIGALGFLIGPLVVIVVKTAIEVNVFSQSNTDKNS
ncbi:sporulation integral membrane protein YtvI [Geomicrobium sediminis]|uniref:Sporulation integral membrane protein YtvI n=2 Tax=Geomicrobium sediminis TaxID=1347788 RepID=A0ABS2PD07_9BACL|nr:sporulation integral membrane protein YtvI [Geomicrobium sediminis]